MAQINENYSKLQASYLFSDIAKRVNRFAEENPDQPIIKMGIGDVTEPLPEVCRKAIHDAVDEMGTRTGFHGYGPEQGYAFLREAIAENDYSPRGCEIKPSEIFVSDGSKCDSGNIQEIFSESAKVAIPDPVYPVYVDTNVMGGRTGQNVNGRYEGLVYLESTPDNGYVPSPPEEAVDLIYLCFPNNPTGACATREQLQEWVDYARRNKAIILYDAAYVAFIRDPEVPHSIYEIGGARECAIEFRSFSKNAGFTGTRCAFTVVPEELFAYDSAGEKVSINKLWNRRHTTKFNGVSYPVQRGAAAIYSPEGKKEVKTLTDFYMENAAIIHKTMTELGFSCVGGTNAPYVWIKIDGSSWDFFDELLHKTGIVCTPGAGFGTCGEGHFRLSAFNTRENVEKAMTLIKEHFGK
ncbi:LL-diaminopimelate aminotransferase [Puniceicoccales bacterium CK1056]|uniref:LL-diaminopimelate aminotransferase n=1 Tax=Oceanipulchritudo coccoides TaxID=2706888 RepID=A0A6B2M2T2_9BACT|nr:LL-diaminopimelate aminotransferase [Oceanipulchritudo coccoides]NDV62706.1 LL-diaminopimelate aminotransferase [Oceanipulchritudo coccoides]